MKELTKALSKAIDAEKQAQAYKEKCDQKAKEAGWDLEAATKERERLEMAVAEVEAMVARALGGEPVAVNTKRKPCRNLVSVQSSPIVPLGGTTGCGTSVDSNNNPLTSLDGIEGRATA